MGSLIASKYDGLKLFLLSTGIDSVFSKIGCDSTAITDMLGGHAGVTETTVLQYLGIVEQRTNELLQLQAFLQAKVHAHTYTVTDVYMYVSVCCVSL